MLHLFEGFGVELEYMLVHVKDLSVCPVTDKVIFEVVQEYLNEIELGEIAWSNEVVLHVIELKTNGPSKDLESLAALFQENIKKINQILAKYDAILLPTGMHPFLNPLSDEIKLWPYGQNEIYETYNRIFDCRGHGWSNLQSAQINLPFSGDKEFARLHAAIRLILPILPAISASTPIIEGKRTTFHDTRLEVYRKNQDKIPSIVGKVIPERVFTKKDYEDIILKKMYQDVSVYDPEGILQEGWLNSRGAIAHFQRGAIEIRTLDIQECPVVDLAIMGLVVDVLKYLISEKGISFEAQKKWDEERLAAILLPLIREGESGLITDLEYLNIFGVKQTEICSANELWKSIVNLMRKEKKEIPFWWHQINIILKNGTLATRILKALDKHDFSMEKIRELYFQLSQCLVKGEMFLG